MILYSLLEFVVLSYVIFLVSSFQDPFLRISRIVEGGGCIPICKTEVVRDNLNPIWRPLSLSMQQFVSKVIFFNKACSVILVDENMKSSIRI